MLYEEIIWCKQIDGNFTYKLLQYIECKIKVIVRNIKTNNKLSQKRRNKE
ncbi:hypothetical protein SKL01_23890 [Staphylococcus kloosii]|uniref:Uncharacterized protein n=1 Tax=Staphylococcus kloosii TaxID=29384 RepID=A0ABQ0XP58_9STAP|nr:hypothetical protein SKL01_23890 [Staphylococcus kloosii]